MEKQQNSIIVSDLKVMMGKPVIAGTRITVESILEKLTAGETIEQILEAHPRLNRQAIQAALAFAPEVLVLSDRDRDLFLSLLENPPEPCEALKSAMYKYQNKYENKLLNDE